MTEHATNSQSAEIAETSARHDGRDGPRKVAAAIRALQTTYVECPRCHLGSASIPSGDQFICNICALDSRTRRDRMERKQAAATNR